MRQYVAHMKNGLIITVLVLALAQPLVSQTSTEYVFPVDAADISRLTWTRDHWDGSNAVDIFFEHGTDLHDPDFQAFQDSRILAVTDGQVVRFDNERGGKALFIEADTGYRFYYAHLAEVYVATGDRVAAGQTIGRMGNTGRWTRYIEPHLHFEITSPRFRGGLFHSDVHAATWLKEHFGYGPEPARVTDYPASIPRGSPVRAPFRIMTTFEQAQEQNSDTAAITIRVLDEQQAVPVHSPLVGEIRVHRNPFFGMRVQITNRHLDETVVISGLQDIRVSTWDVVYTGDVLGYTADSVNIMYFRQGELTDPRVFF